MLNNAVEIAQDKGILSPPFLAPPIFLGLAFAGRMLLVLRLDPVP